MHFLASLSPIVFLLLVNLITLSMALLGSASVFFFKKTNKKVVNFIFGISSGIMLAGIFFSLLSPAVSLSITLDYKPWFHLLLGFLTGSVFVVGASLLLEKTQKQKSSKNRRKFLLVMAGFLYNIPEGLSVGIAIGSIVFKTAGHSLASVILLTLGIGIQNIPQGAANALSLRKSGVSRKRAFLLSSSCALIEPIFAVVGFYLVKISLAVLPFALAFAAGALVCVIVSELLPEAAGENKYLATSGCTCGFLLMMVLNLIF